jgi:hypothetical protein
MNGRSKPLTDDEKAKFFDEHGHLMYRYTMLWTHKLRFPNNHGFEHCHAVCAFEASLLACRVFLEFLGLGVNPKVQPPDLKENRVYNYPDDVKVIDLGGSFVNISDIKPKDRQLLADVYYMAGKANAHLTQGASIKEATIVHEAISVIDTLLRQNLYGRLGQRPKGHWDRHPTP